MLAPGLQIAQSRPNNTTTNSIFTASLATEIGLIVVCNVTGSAADFSIYHDDDGSTFDQSTALHYQQSLAGNSTLYIGADYVGSGITVLPDGQIGVQSGTANAITYTVYGVTEEVAREGVI